MGMETAAIVMATVAVSAELGASAYEVKAANAREDALNLQAKEMQLQTQQKVLRNYDVMEKVVSAQIAHQTTTGTAANSPSFNAIQRNTLNIGAKEAANIAIEGNISQQNNEIEKENVKNTLYAQLFGNAANTALSVASVYNKVPKRA